MRIVVTGAAGRLGGRLVEVLKQRGHDVAGVDIIQTEQVSPLDLSDFDATHKFIYAHRPEVVFHPAAWTDVDGCAREPEKAIAINGFGTQHVALATAAVQAAMVYISTNEVFDGRSSRPYYEYDLTNPVNPYGYSKWVGERALTTLNPRHYLVRTAWLFAHGGKNFIQTILNAAQAGKNLRIVTNEIANPTYNDDLAEALGSLIETGRYGIYHLVNEGACSRYEFARYFLDKAGYNDTPIEPIAAQEWQRASTPPTYAALHNLAGKQIGITLRPWQEAVAAFLAREGLWRE
ncbi:MAG TPA: dTDP-4-dehydrorhamnose reductase [Phototrophicaceae bacterium]|nr:dTDP-4-dehydrorhamnose reductase [Phototrophicaceae bacterium]